MEIEETYTPPEEQTLEEIEKICAECDDGGSVSIFRISEKGKPYLAKVPIDAFSLEYVAEQWGGGTYEFRIYNSQGLVKRPKFTIDESRKPKPPAPADTDDSGHARGGLQSEIEASIEKRIREMDAAKRANAVPWLDIIKASAPILAAWISNRPTPSTPESLITKMIDRIDAKNDSIGEMQRMFEVFRTMREMSGEGGGGGGEGDGSLIGSLTRNIGPLIDKFASMPSAPRPQVQAPHQRPALPNAQTAPAPNGGTQAPPAGVESDSFKRNPAAQSEMNLIATAIRPLLIHVVNSAQMDFDHETVAAQIQEKIPDQYWEAVASHLERPDWFEQFFAEIPDAPQVRPYIERVRDLLLSDPEENDDVPENVIDPAKAMETETETEKDQAHEKS